MIILKGSDDSVAIMELAEGANKEEAIKKLNESGDIKYTPVNGEFKLPSSREFRDAWKVSEVGIVLDKKKVKEIHLERVRKRRDEKLKELDVEVMKNLSNKEKLEELFFLKQVLRDLPQTIKYKEWDVKLLGEKLC